MHVRRLLGNGLSPQLEDSLNYRSEGCGTGAHLPSCGQWDVQDGLENPANTLMLSFFFLRSKVPDVKKAQTFSTAFKNKANLIINEK